MAYNSKYKQRKQVRPKGNSPSHVSRKDLEQATALALDLAILANSQIVTLMRLGKWSIPAVIVVIALGWLL